MSKHGILNYKDEEMGIVHLKSMGGDGEFTLCGFAFDAPATEEDRECMVETNEPCNCSKCIAIMDDLLPYLKHESRRVDRKNVVDTTDYLF